MIGLCSMLEKRIQFEIAEAMDIASSQEVEKEVLQICPSCKDFLSCKRILKLFEIADSRLSSVEKDLKEVLRTEMKIYMIDEPYHEPLGYFSTLEKAKERRQEIWKEREYPEPTQKADGYWYYADGLKSIIIYITEITVED